ncbi:hypothetical protein APTSU1_000503600 [Apodemus speciosus]|uniref:Uncharacterized protein n=1 Tax=Apodemus speciosus TaxID=105296 RepID=A0ABQ0ES02_APOSI
MKILILTVTTLNFVIFFPYNGSQEIHSQTNQHFSANPPLCKQMASNPSSTHKTEENSPTEDSDSYPAPLDEIAKITGSPSEGNHLEMLQADLRNFPLSDNDVLQSLFTDQNSIGFAYAKGTVDNPKSNTSPSSDIIQNMAAVSSFAPNSQIIIIPRRTRMPLSRENGISSPVSVIHYQSKKDPSDTPDFNIDSEITQSLEHFPTTGRTKAMFASDPATYWQNSLEKLTVLADESGIVTSKDQSFLGIGTTTNEEAEQEDVFFTGSTAPIEEVILIPRKHFKSLIDKEMPSKEKSVLYTEVESEAEEDAVFQEAEDIPSSHNLQHFALQYSSVENDEFPDSGTTNSHSQFTVVPSTKITINDRDLIIPEEEHVDALYVTNPTNKKIYFKSMATRTNINSVDESAGTRHNLETEGSTAVPTSSNPMHQIERMGYSRPFNIYYDVNSEPIPGAEKDPYVTWNTIKDKQLSSTMYSGNIIDLGDGYQTHADITAKKNDRLTNQRKAVSNEGRNNIHVIPDVANDDFYKYKDSVKIDLASKVAAWPIKKYIIKSNDIKTLKEKPNDLGRASSDHPKVSRDEETIIIDNSIAPFNTSQAKNGEISLSTILVPKTYLPNKTTKTAWKVGMTTASHEAENIFSSLRHKLEASFEEDATLDYEDDLQRVESIKSEEEDTFEDEKIRDYIENNLADTQYSTNPDAHDTTTFRRIIKPRAGQPGFEVLNNVVSKPLLGNFNPEIQRKKTATNSNHDSNSDEHFNDNIYTVMEENGPNIYIFTPEAMPSFIRRGSSIPMKDNTNPGKAKNDISKTNLMAILNQFNVNKMPPNATVLSPDISALEYQEDNDNNRNSAPSAEIQPIGLRSVLISNQRVFRPPVSLGDSDMSPDTLVMSKVSEPTKEYLTSIDQNWEVIDELGAVKPFPQVSLVPLEDPMTFPEKVTRGTNILPSENGDISDKSDSMALSANRDLQTATNGKRGINRATELVSHHDQQSAISPSAKESVIAGTEAGTSLYNNKAVEEEKFYMLVDSIPVDLEELNIMKVTPFIRKPLVASAQQKELESSKKTFYPGSTMSTEKLVKVQGRDPLPDNLEQWINSYTKTYQSPMKITFSPTDFIENSNSKPLTTQNIIILPENLIKDFGLMSEKSSTDYSEIEPLTWDIIEFFDLINETDDQEGQAIKLQTDFHPLTLNSIVPFKTSANVIRDSINNDTGSSTMERENILTKMPYSQNNNEPLVEFSFISNEFPLVDDSEDLYNMASLPFIPVNTMYTGEGAIISEIDADSEGETVLTEEGGYKIFLALKQPAKPWFIPDASTEYLEMSGPLTIDSWSNSPTAWSDNLEIKDDYANFIDVMAYLKRNV